ncbi:MAG TPA: mannosyltransferase [Desulfitobacterium dehalogenans]|uniref:Mannosyltransferase n=1 Tax=Desulfitobacterium dehalogenans TaxID=36854 RepID=A0A7C7D4X2_9FIRM|nr:mannosyltransferase [Desulfitobacterium dehalogenans]
MDHLKDNLNKVVDAAKERIDGAVKKTEELLDKPEVKQKVEGIKDLAEDKAGVIAGRAEEFKDYIEDKLGDMMERAEELKDVVEDKAEEIADKLEGKAEKYKDKIEGMFKKE